MCPLEEAYTTKKISSIGMYVSTIDDEGIAELLAFGSSVDVIGGPCGQGLLRIKNGITMDSGSAGMVMPTSWLPMFALQASEGQRR